MYDAWAAYDTTAVGYLHHERQSAVDVELARREAISYAAYRLLKSRYINSANAATTSAALDARFAALGYSSAFTSTVGNTPAALGNRIAATVMAWGLEDGSNQQNKYFDATYQYTQPAMVVFAHGFLQGGFPPLTDPNRWQPLAFDAAFTQNGLASTNVQLFVGGTWLHTTPFALERDDPALPWLNPGAPSRLGTATDAAYKEGAMEILRASSRLNSIEPIDISPGLGGLGNNSLGLNDGTGHSLNPVTGLPYVPYTVSMGNYERVLAEFWADGPHSETPPGHWHVIANQVADHPLHQKRIGGLGPVVSALEWDVKTYFAMSAACHDAACVAWSIKRYYDGVRPITMIRFMGSYGQSSDPGLPSYHPWGLPLEPGVVELITDETAYNGGKHVGAGDTGQIALYSWPGQPDDPATQTSPVGWINSSMWQPYQRRTFNTPAFPGFVSGHSTFSRAAAEVLTKITGTPFFPGGLSTFTANVNAYLAFERGPSETVTLQWATYYDAADQAGRSRIFGGIHVPEDDHFGRISGSEAGLRAWALVTKYWDGSILQAPESPELAILAASQARLRYATKRGMQYRVQRSLDLVDWSDVSNLTRAHDTKAEWTGPLTNEPREFYRVEESVVPSAPAP